MGGAERALPWEKGEKHLAVEVEDHPVEYATFEGIIPQGQYGGGTVMVWDRGNYHVYGEEPLKALREGRLHLVLDGEKAKGEWALIRTRMDGGKSQWLLLLKAGRALSRSRRSATMNRSRPGARWRKSRRKKMRNGSRIGRGEEAGLEVADQSGA